MRKLLKFIYTRIILGFIRLISPLFFKKKHLTGRWFDKHYLGWHWVLKAIITQKLLGVNRKTPWPVSVFSSVGYPENIVFHPDNLDNFQSRGCYFQASPDAKIYIGRGTYIASNVGLITSNHDPNDLSRKLPGKDVRIGENCWIGMNSVILPGVILSDNTIVGAGSVVTKSFFRRKLCHCRISGKNNKIFE